MISLHQVRSVVVFSLFGIVSLCGCSGSQETGQTPVFPAKGKIIFQGKPLDDATVNFVSTSGKPVARGSTDENGEYTVSTYKEGDGAAEGEVVVLVTKMESSAPKTASTEYGASAPYPGSKSSSKYIVPKIYTNRDTSPLKVTVTTDEAKNVFDFEIK